LVKPPGLRCSLLLAVALAAAGCEDYRRGYQPGVGDLVFQSLPHNPVVDAIEGSTHSPYSHCGIVVQREAGFYVLEAIGPVKETALDAWLERGRGHQFAVFRFKEPYRSRIPGVIERARQFLGRPYDIHYDFDDARIYCSELIFKAFKAEVGEELGKVRRLGDLEWKPYEGTMIQIENAAPPLDREMITPKDLSEAAQLEKVFAHGI
jgi:hypothetical protein